MISKNRLFTLLLLFAVVACAIPAMVSARGSDIKTIVSGDMIFPYEEGLDISGLRDATVPGTHCTWTAPVAGICHGILLADEVACNAHADSTTCTADALCSWTAPIPGDCSGAIACNAYDGTDSATCTAAYAVDPIYGADVIELVKCDDPPSGGTCTHIHDFSIPDDEDFTLYSSLVGDNYGIYYAFDGTDVSNKNVRIQPANVQLDAVLAAYPTDSVNGDTITRDTEVKFKITSSNVGSTYHNSGGGQRATVDLEVTTPGGGTLTTFGGLDLSDITVSGPEFYTGEIDLSGVEAGTYKIKAVWSSPNEFVDQAPDSNQVTFSISTKVLTITTNKETVVRGNSFAITVTGESKKDYYLYVMSGATDYPVFLAAQTDVTQMTAPSGITDEAGVTGTFAKVKTGTGGSITVEFTTENITDTETYDIRVQDIADSSKYDTVSVEVSEGDITLSMGGSGTFYMGDEIQLIGTNTESDDVYLFITGPNLNSDGVKLNDPSVDVETGDENTFKKVSVDADNAWKYKWDTSAFTTVLDAGTYTVYAVSAPRGKGDLSGYTYQTAAITLKKSYVTIKLSSNSVASGDEFFITGTVTGNPDRLYVWMFGKNYRNMYNAVSVDNDGTYEWDLGDTIDLYSGQYYVLVQHPMANGAGIYGVDSGMSACSGLNCWGMSSDEDVWGSTSVRLSGLQASDAAKALKDAIDSPNIDDVYAATSFVIDNPYIRLKSIPQSQIGSEITIVGTTNLATGDTIQIEVVSAAFKPTEKTQSGEFSSAAGSVSVYTSNETGTNEFTFKFDTDGFKSDEYIVTAEAIETGTLATQTFTLLDTPPTTIATPTPVPTTPPVMTTAPPTIAPPPTAATTVAPTPTETKAPGFGAVIALAGLGAVALLILRKDTQ